MRFMKRYSVILTIIILMLSLLCGCSAGQLTAHPKANDPITGAATVTTGESGNADQEQPETQTEVKELSVTDLLKDVLTLKSELKSALEEIEDQDADKAYERLSGIDGKIQTIGLSLDATVDNMGDIFPSIKKQLENIQDILDLIDTANRRILKPAAVMLRDNPLDGLSTSDGFRVNALEKYIDFAEGLIPAAEQLIEQAQTVDLTVVDSDGDLQRKLEKAVEVVDFYHANPNSIASLKSMLGMNGNRTYLLAAQNSAEIRASGGFPGAMGILRIQNGILTMDDFKKVYDMLSSYTPVEAKLTNQEANLFHGGMSAPRDADYCPDFERVGYIWALGYESRQKESVDGVISMTPVLVQRLLDVMDEEITLFDGLTMNGTNACHVLQYDLYYKYFSNQYVANAETLSDQLFADAAKKTMLLLFDHLDGKSLSGYIDAASESLDDRTMMFWMKDEAEQAILQKAGWNGGLNKDAERPAAGIYVNCTIASKMGIFLEMDTEIGKRTQNEDGSYTYPVTVTFRNSMSKDEVSKAGQYITGGAGGSYSGSAYLFAPAGGTISNFSSENNVYVRQDNYHDLDLYYIQSLSIGAGKSIMVTYDITTAPGSVADLTLSMTPTIQNYR